MPEPENSELFPCMVAYQMTGGDGDPFTALAKVRAKGVDDHTYGLTRRLYGTAFGPGADDGIAVPEPLGVIPRLHLWLQRQVAGAGADLLLSGPGADRLAARIADAAAKLHRNGPPPHRDA